MTKAKLNTGTRVSWLDHNFHRWTGEVVGTNIGLNDRLYYVVQIDGGEYIEGDEQSLRTEQ